MIIREALARATARLVDEGGLARAEARREALLLMAETLGHNRAWLAAHDDEPLSEGDHETFEGRIRRRVRGEPVAHILGKRSFWTFELAVSADTLIPRPETELLVEVALERGPEGAACVLDLGTGTGAIACALASERPGWKVIAVEASVGAREVARQNVERLRLSERVRLLASDWFKDVPPGQEFDLIVSNPPYIEEADPHLAQGDVRFEPRTALVAGPDGLSDIRHIVAESPAYLKPEGWLILEHGWNQGEAVRTLFGSERWKNVSTRKDFAGHDRITLGQLRGAIP